MADDIQKVGIEAVLQGAPEYVAAQEKINAATEKGTTDTAAYAAAQQVLEKNVTAVTLGIQTQLELLTKLGSDIDLQGQEFVAVGTDIGKAMEGDAEAFQRVKDFVAELNTEIENLLDHQRELAGVTTETTSALTTEADASEAVSTNGYKIGLAFFALSIAARGVRDIGRELGQVYGEEVTKGFQTAADAIQTIGSFGSAGALIGSLGGAGGTAIGAGVGGTIGIIAALTSVMLQLSPEVDTLNKSLETLGKQDRTVDTLSKILNITTEEAQAMYDLAKASPAAGEALTKLTENTEPVSKLQVELIGVGVAMESLQKISQGTGNATDISNISTDFTKLGEAARKAGADQAQSALDAQAALEPNTKAVADLNKEYSAFIEKLSPVKDSLSEITGITVDDTTAIQNYIKGHKDAGDALGETLTALEKVKDAQLQDTEHAGLYTAAIQRLTTEARAESDALLGDALAEQQNTAALKEGITAQEDYAASVEKTNRALAQLADKTGQQYAQAQQQYNDSIAKAGSNLDDARTKAETTENDALVKLRLQYNERIAAIDQQLADRSADISQQLSDRLSDIRTRLADTLVQAEQSQQDRIDQIRAEQQDSLIHLDQTTHDQIQHAQTQHDIEEIKRKAEISKQDINDRANDAASASQDQFQKQVQNAQRSATEEIAIARRTAREQEAIANRTADEQRATAKQTAQDGADAAAKAFGDAATAAIKAYNDAKDAAVTALGERDKAINASYLNERNQIEQTYQDALKKLEELILKVNQFNLAAVYALSLQGFIQGLGLTPSTSGIIPSFSPNILNSLFGGGVSGGTSRGGNATNNTYSSSQTSNGQTYIFNISNVDNARDIVKQIDQYLLDR